MTAEQKTGDGHRLNQDEIIEDLVPDPAQIPQVKLLVGWLGKSSQSDCWRLYLTPTLNDFLEFQAKEVVHYQRLTPEQSPLGGTFVWVKQEAEVRRVRNTATQTQAEFLQGDIMAQFQGRPDGTAIFDLVAGAGPVHIWWTFLLIGLLAGLLVGGIMSAAACSNWVDCE